jgi:dsDNA-binding SOS-regulon protein
MKNNESLLENDCVKELIDYIESLEDELVESKQIIKSSKEQILLIFLKEIRRDLNQTIRDRKINKNNDLWKFSENLNQFFLDNNL